MKIKQHARVALQSAMATFFVALAVVGITQAATTIGTNITTTGIVDITASSDTPLTINGATASTTLAVYQSSTGDIVNVFDGSTEVLTVLDGGNTGVGSSTPNATLAVQAAAGKTAFMVGSTTAELFTINASGVTVGNEDGLAFADFRWEGDAQANLLQVDASADRVGIASSTPYAILSVEALTGQQAFIVGSSTAELFKIDASGAVSFNGGGWSVADLTVQGDAQANLLQVDASADRVGIASSTPQAVLAVQALTGQAAFMVGSTTAELFTINASGVTVVNEDGLAFADFRVESDSLSDAFMVDASANRIGIGSTTPWGLLAVEQATETYSFIVMNQGSTTPSFVVNGVNGDGRVGIASSSPSAMFSVGSGSATSTIDLGKVCFRSQTDGGATIYWWFATGVTGLGGDINLATSTTSCF